MPTSRQLQQKVQELQQQYDLLSTKIGRLQTAWAIETDPANKFKFETQVKEAKVEREQLDRELQELEQQPSNLLAEQQEQEHHQPKKQASSSGVQIGNVSGGITNSTIAGRDVSDVTITGRKDKKRKAKRNRVAENDGKQNS